MLNTALEETVKQAIARLYLSDSELLRQDASEWAIAHRLAVYIEQGLSGWHVDCEYNRQGKGDDVKRMPNSLPVRPDIAIHHRGQKSSAHNLLVIEIKKNETDSDIEKAQEYTRCPQGDRKFQYQYGLALAVEQSPKLHWFAKGKEIR